MLKELLQLKEPFYIARHEESPLPAEREAFLKTLLEQGTSLAAVRGVAYARNGSGLIPSVIRQPPTCFALESISTLSAPGSVTSPLTPPTSMPKRIFK